jgi:hypothetical protein
MFSSFAIYIARNYVASHQNDKEVLVNLNVILYCMEEALRQIDKIFNKPPKKDIEYKQAVAVHEESDIVFENIKFLHLNLDFKQYDNSLNFEDKRIIIENSITYFEEKFYPLTIDDDYKNYQRSLYDNKKYKNHRTYEYIMLGLKKKINYQNKYPGDDYIESIMRILNSMRAINMNFYVERKDNFRIYPLLVDLLSDIFSAEYSWSIDKEIIKAIITEWNGAKIAQKERNAFDFVFYTKMQLIEKVKYNGLKVFILAEYTRKLGVDKIKLRTFMQNILYYDVKNHKNSPKLEFEIIDSIPVRPFMLEETKYVIGGI